MVNRHESVKSVWERVGLWWEGFVKVVGFEKE